MSQSYYLMAEILKLLPHKYMWEFTRVFQKIKTPNELREFSVNAGLQSILEETGTFAPLFFTLHRIIHQISLIKNMETFDVP